MIPRQPRTAAIAVALASAVAALWLLLFAAPELLDAHSDGGALAALALYLGVPAGVAWGGTRLWPFLVPRDDDDVDHDD